ncbi:MAG TPA: lipopolysaccharide biosynthesis protein RfbH [Candidatus Bilamarchaeaceae archaeon]|nr:lipopolysaccharide biosynthesis protein RfbH [Candidatus Bilamarchaeaceae archaeon]
MKEDTDIKRAIFNLVKQFYLSKSNKSKFEPGETAIPYAGRVYDEQEIINLVDSSLDFWLTAGKYAQEFEKEFATFFGSKYCLLANSGSSANLLALSALTSKSLGEKRLKKGEKIITVTAGFPTTVNPIFQNGLVPVFLDVELGTYNIDTTLLEEAIDEKTRGIVLAHTLGNPFDLDKITSIAKKHGLYLIEDCCDAVGATFDGKPVGTFGDIATVSFYPAHHMTMGEGGAVLTSKPILKKSIESFRDWGRDCWCQPGESNTCGKRFGWKLGQLPEGYDHKYIYSNIGYNLKVTDMQAAVGLAQLKKLPEFIKKRKENFNYYYQNLKDYEEYFVLPKKHPKADPSPFGFPLTIREGVQFTKNQIVAFLESKKITTRMLFGGNLIRQPAYLDEKYEIIGDLKNSDYIMNNTFWIGVYPGLTNEMRMYVVDQFEKFLRL